MRRLALTIATAIVFLALVPAAGAKQAVDFFGGSGTEGGQFGHESGGIAVNNSGAGPANAGDIYVADPNNNRIERFGRDEHGTPADATDDTYFFISAWGADVVSTGGSGDLGDEAARDYEICTVASQCKQGVASGGNGTTAGDGSLAAPNAIAVDQDTGNVYVSDAGNHRIDVYDGDGAFLRSFGFDVVASGPENSGVGYETCIAAVDVCKAGSSGGGVGQVGTATGIAVSQPDANPATGTVFLSDSGNERVETYHHDGTSPSSFGSGTVFNAGIGWNSPQAVAVDSRGIVYVANKLGFGNGTAQIERYDSQNANGGGIGFIAPIASPTNEQQQLTFNATAGQFRLSFEGDTTADLPFNASTNQVRESLEALPSIGPGNVAVSQSTFDGHEHHFVTFKGALALTDVAQLVVSNGTTPLTGNIAVASLNGHTGALEPGSAPSALAIDPDEDGAGPETDVLYAGFSNLIQQFGPANPPGLSAAPSAVDDTHGDNGAVGSAGGLVAEPSTGRLYAAASGTAGPGVYVLDTPGTTPPEGTLDSLDGVGAHGVTAHATINPNGLPVTSYHFEYSDDGSKWTSTQTVVLGAQETPQAIEETIEPPGPGLRPHTLYHVRLVYQRRFTAAVTTAELTATTLAVPPLAETTGSPLRTTTTATLLGRIDPNDSPATYRFQYGTQGPCDANPCAETAPVSAGAGDEFEFASQEIEGLEPDTAYHYRILADNGVGSSVLGADRTIATRATDAPLSHGNFPGPPGSDRAYELVSISDSAGSPFGLFGGKAFSADGNRAAYPIFGGTPISDSGSLFGLYFAQRPPGAHPTSGWQTRLITPPRKQLLGPNWDLQLYGAEDLSHLVDANTPTVSLAGPHAVWRLAAEGPPAKLSEPAPPTEFAGVGANGGVDNTIGVSSADTSRVISILNRGSIDPAFPAAAGVPSLYDVSSGGTPQLISLMPSGQPPVCGLAKDAPGAFQHASAQAAHWVSEDGSRVLFQSRGDNCSSAIQLYQRDLLTAETKLLSGPPLSGPACGAALVRATPDAVFFATQTRLDPDDAEPATCDGNNNDVYRYDLAGEDLECLTCLVPGLPASVVGDSLYSLALAEDGSRLYFSAGPLLPGTPGGIYRLDVASGNLAYVAPDGDLGSLASSGGLSSDGRFLLFRSSAASLNPLGGAFQNGDTEQYYLYDDAERSLVCVSCPPDGSAPLAAADPDLTRGDRGSPGVRPLADDGTVAFGTTTPLVGADQNTPSSGDLIPGADVYEFRDGRPLLVSDGLTNWLAGEGPLPMSVSRSGRDVFFTAAARYTPDAIDGIRRLYTARIGGGIDFPPPPKPCPLEVCQGTPKGAPEEQEPASANFAGRGNEVGAPSARCRKGKVRRRGRCVPRHKPRKSKQRSHGRAANNDRRAVR